MLNHQLVEVLELGPLSWAGHQVHVSLPINQFSNAGVDPKEILLPHEFILNRDLLAQLYPSFAEGAAPFFTFNWSKYAEFLTFRGGLDPQIHTVVMSLNYSGVEIKTTHSVESWNGGVLLMASGSVHVMDLSPRRKFVQTFFLAPQQKGFVVLNDVFHFIDDEPIHQHSMVYVTESNLESKLKASNALREQVSNYILGGEMHASGFVAPCDIRENGAVDNYSFQEQLIQQVPEAQKLLDDNSAVQSNGSLQSTMNPVQEHLYSLIKEPVGEPQKHTYASILQVAKGQSPPLVHSQPYFNKSNTPASEWHHVTEPATQQSFASSVAVEMSGAENVDDFSPLDDEGIQTFSGEVKSVYVRNLSSTMSASEIGEEFEKFGKLTPDGVAIRNRKDIGVCYAFVEFEDISGVQNAIKAATVQVAGHQLFIEERRPNRNNSLRGGRSGRGRGSYLADAPRGRFGGRSFGNWGDRDYYRPRGNGFYRPSSRQERGFSSN